MSATTAFARRMGRLLGEPARAMVGVERGQGWARVVAWRVASIRHMAGAGGRPGTQGTSSCGHARGKRSRRAAARPADEGDLKASLALECRNLIGYPIEVIRCEVLGAQSGNRDRCPRRRRAAAPDETCRARVRWARSAAAQSGRRSRSPSLPAWARGDEAVAYLDLGPREAISIFRGDEIRLRSATSGQPRSSTPGRSWCLTKVCGSSINGRRSAALEQGSRGRGGRPPSAIRLRRPGHARRASSGWCASSGTRSTTCEQFWGSDGKPDRCTQETARVWLAAHLAGVLKMPVGRSILNPGRRACRGLWPAWATRTRERSTPRAVGSGTALETGGSDPAEDCGRGLWSSSPCRFRPR